MTNENNPDFKSGFKCLLHNTSISQTAFPKSFVLSKYFGSIWMHNKWLLRHWQRHLLCSMLHPRATCVFVDNVRHSHVRMDPLCVFFLKLYLNKFLLPSTFDGIANQTITWFFWVPINSAALMCVFFICLSALICITVIFCLWLHPSFLIMLTPLLWISLYFPVLSGSPLNWTRIHAEGIQCWCCFLYWLFSNTWKPEILLK